MSEKSPLGLESLSGNENHALNWSLSPQDDHVILASVGPEYPSSHLKAESTLVFARVLQTNGNIQNILNPTAQSTDQNWSNADCIIWFNRIFILPLGPACWGRNKSEY